MLAGLRRRLADPALGGQLHALAGTAPAAAPLSLTLDLGSGGADWLAAVPANTPFWYQAQPARGLWRLALGHALQVTSAGANRFAALDNAFAGIARAWRYNAPPLAFCGFAFAEQGDDPLPNALLSIPAIVLETRAGRCRAILSTPAEQIGVAAAGWQALLAKAAPAPALQLQPLADQTLADRAWIARVRAALRDIAGGRMDKVVLARNRHLEASAPVAPATLLATLNEQQPEAMIYACSNGHDTFLGATPERLVRLAGRQLTADALAGTAWPGSPELAGAKNRHEQALVADAISAVLARCCVGAPQAGPLEVHAAGHLSHLRTRISGMTAPGVTLFDLLRALHPTPAVGGFPVAAATAWLSGHGEARHGWYSGGFGTLAPDGNGEFHVALRSALISGRHIELQAGAGIVAGSDPELELAETDAKLATLHAALSTPPVAATGARA